MPEYAWLCLDISGNAWNMLKHAWICLSLPEWLLFYIPPFTHLFFNPFSTWTRVTYLNVYRRLQVIGYSLKEHEAVFWKRQHLIFWIAAGSITFIFCIRLNNLYKQDLNFQLLFTAEENKENREEGGRAGGGGGWILICPSSVVLFLVKTCKEIT